jgi:hypothetical protein
MLVKRSNANMADGTSEVMADNLGRLSHYGSFALAAIFYF